MVIPKVNISSQYLRRDEIYVSILEVKSPSHIIVKESPSINTSSHAKEFVEAEESMQIYYQSLKTEFLQVPLQGSIVVVQHKQKYYRARVQNYFSVSEGHIFKVYLLDYGIECNVPGQNLYEIRPDFSKHPFQAVELKLLDVEPISLVVNMGMDIDYGPVETWDLSAVAFIKDMIKVMNSAHVKVKGVGDNFLFGSLYMTFDDQKVLCINEELKNRKFAQSKEDFWNNVIAIDDILPKVELNSNNGQPGIEHEDRDPVTPRSSEYISTPTLSQRPVPHSLEISPSASVSHTPKQPQSEYSGKFHKLGQLKKKTSTGQPSSATPSPVAIDCSTTPSVDVDCADNRNETSAAVDESLNSQSKYLGKFHKLGQLKKKTSTEQPSSATPSPVAVDESLNSQREYSGKFHKLGQLKKKTSTGQPSSATHSPVDVNRADNRNETSTVVDESLNSQSKYLGKFHKLGQLKKKTSNGHLSSATSSPVTVDCSTTPSVDVGCDETSAVVNESMSTPQGNTATNQTPIKIEVSGQSKWQRMSQLKKSSPSLQKTPNSSTPLSNQVSCETPPYLAAAQTGNAQASAIEGISPIMTANVDNGTSSTRKSEGDWSSMKDETNSLNVAFMNSTQPKDVKNLSELNEIEKSNSLNAKSPKPSSHMSKEKLQNLKNMYKKVGTAVPKPEEKVDENSSPPVVETTLGSESESSIPQFEEGYLEEFSAEADQLDIVLNPKCMPASESGLSSPDSSRKSSISNDSMPDLQPVNEIDFSDKSLWEKQKVPALCIGEAIPSPLLATGEASFPPALQKTLNHLNFGGPSCIQSVVWPAVERRRCLAAVAPPRSGKTVAYLLPIVANFMTPVTHADLPKTNGPIVVIICSSWKKVQAVYDLFQYFLSGTKCKILTFFSGGTNKRIKQAALLNGCDVLISVPSCLLQFFNDGVLCVKRCCHFVLDDGSTLVSQNMKELKELMRHFARGIELRPPIPISLQVLICAERWSKGVASFVDKFMHTPLLLFTSFLEAAVYARVPMHAHVCEEQDKNQKLLEILEISKKTIICTNSSKKAFEIHDFLKCENVRSFLVNEEMEHYISDGVIQDWKSVRSSATPHCLVLTDAAFSHLRISSANVLIHYDLPEISRLQFGNRFSCIAEHFIHLNGTPDCTCHILVSGDCSLQAPSLLKLIQRSGIEVSPELKALVTKQTVKKNTDAPLCHYMKSFGLCTLPNCQQRHQIDPALDMPKVTPREGDVSCLVTHICDPTHLYVRVLKYLSPELTSLSGCYAKIGFQLRKYYSLEENRRRVGEPVVGETYVYEGDGGLFFRVKVLTIITTKDQSQKLQLLFRDEGWVQTLEFCRLFEYIGADQFPPPLVVEVYLCGLRTPDTSLDWNPQARRHMARLVEGKEIHGKIVLCLGETIWLHPVVLRKKLVFLDDYLNVLSLDKTLKDAEYAIENKNHLPLLLKACENKIPLPKEIKRVPEAPKIEKEEPTQYSYAFLELDVEENVFVSSVISPHEFYVQREKFITCLDELLNKIDNKVKAEELTKCKAFQNGMHCLAPFEEDNCYYRAEVTEVIPDSEDVQVFFVDFGDFGRVSKDSIFSLPPELSLLPFQAIKCELDGICAPHGGWTEKAGETLFYLTRNGEGDMNILQIVAYEKSQQYGNSNHYIVDLWYSDKSLSAQLLSTGLAIPVEKPASLKEKDSSESDKDIFEDAKDQFEDASDDGKNGYVASSGSGEEWDQEDAENNAKFWLHVFGINPNVPRKEGAEKVTDNVSRMSVPKMSPKKVAKKKAQKVVEEVEIAPTRSPFQATQRLMKCRKNEPKRAKPFIQWWNTTEHVNILINLRNIEIYELDVQDNKFVFSTSLRGMDYHTVEEFFSSVHSKEAITKNTPEGVNIILKKQTPEQWPQLTKNKFSHIKYDLNHIDDSDSEEMITNEETLAEMENPGEIAAAHYESEDNESSEDEDYIQPWKKLAQYKDPFDPLD